MRKNIIVSFATNEKWYRSQALLNQSAKKYGFNGAINYTDKNRKWSFIEKYQDISKTRGYGFWQWKPIILLDAMSQVNDGDIVAYIDSGNTIINSLHDIFTICEEREIVLFDNRDGNFEGVPHKNRHWTKRDCFVLMDCDNEKYYESSQVDASYQFYKKTSYTLEFLHEYSKYCNNDNIISDIPNTTKANLPEFKDHRHDQSILSLMAAKEGIQLLPEPSEWGNRIADRPYPQLFWHHRGVF